MSFNAPTELRDNNNNYYRRRRLAHPNPVRQDAVRIDHGSASSEVQYRGNNNDRLPQLAQEIQEKLAKGAAECMICYDAVRRTAPVWSCGSCYSIFHLHCVKKWARAPASANLSADRDRGVNCWRCPGCQFVQLTSPSEIRYVCFCGKRADPPSDLYLTPHSCGEPCGKSLEKEVAAAPGVSGNDECPHVCVLQCHPGPCPPCKQFAPPRICPCGKKTVMTRCSDRRSFLTCGQKCDKILGCGRHRCERVCHLGLCDPCRVVVDASCFCKKKLEAVVCGDMPVKGEVNAQQGLSLGLFSCSSVCGKELGCGNHTCGKICHQGSCGECELLPSKTKTCHCGKSALGDERESCLDLIPTCSQTCGKPLLCGDHFCGEKCHAGNCPPCFTNVSQKCRCASTSRVVECHTTASNEKFACDKSCGRKKSCGRHRCSERCCPVSGQDPHFCSLTCGKKLRCDQHSCKSLCHSGHCPPCLETIFADLTCACGTTSIPPPLPCGTPPPSCQLPCSVPQPCGHQASHNCHFGDCPPCSMPISKECVGGHVVLRNIPCGSKNITCNALCGKTRRCGMHACGRSCHTSPCDEPGQRSSCGQKCGAPRRDCRHICTAPCHPGSPCPNTPCDFPMTITCSCARITTSVPCDVGGHRKLACDDECAKLERKRVLADAFDIAPPSSDVSELLQDLYRRDSKWVISVEERCKYLVLGKSRGGNTAGLKSHVFSPTLNDKRDAIRAIAERWKLAVNLAGWEPKRFVVVHVTPTSKPPTRIIGVKGTTTANVSAPGFDPTMDMDPRLVVAFADLPREADVSSLVLRFGGECELVWLNDKNAMAVFRDRTRAATASRRLVHGSVYHGAVSVHPSGVAVSVSSGGSNAWGGGAGMPQPKPKPKPKPTMLNRWTVVDHETAPSMLSSSSESSSSVGKLVEGSEEVADDWETAYDNDNEGYN